MVLFNNVCEIFFFQIIKGSHIPYFESNNLTSVSFRQVDFLISEKHKISASCIFNTTTQEVFSISLYYGDYSFLWNKSQNYPTSSFDNVIYFKSIIPSEVIAFFSSQLKK